MTILVNCRIHDPTSCRGGVGRVAKRVQQKVGLTKSRQRSHCRLYTENAPRWSATSCSPTDSLRSTIGARGLNFRVRNGTGCASPAMVADQRGAFCCQGASAVPWGPHSAASRRDRTPRRTRGKGRARPISTARLRSSHALHLRPIDLVVYQGPYRRENSSWDWLPA